MTEQTERERALEVAAILKDGENDKVALVARALLAEVKRIEDLEKENLKMRIQPAGAIGVVAEKIASLQAQLKTAVDAVSEQAEQRGKLEAERDRLRAEVAVLRRGLEFYRDANNWVKLNTEPCSAIIADAGTRASQALSSTRASKLLDVVRAEEQLMKCIAEFDNDPSVWGEYIEALDSALAALREGE